MENPKRLVRFYALLVFIAGLAGLINPGINGPIKVLFVFLIIISIGLLMMKKWALYAMVPLVAAVGVYLLWFTWFLDTSVTTGSGSTTYDSIFFTLVLMPLIIYSGGIIYPVYYIFKRRQFFN